VELQDALGCALFLVLYLKRPKVFVLPAIRKPHHVEVVAAGLELEPAVVEPVALEDLAAVIVAQAQGPVVAAVEQEPVVAAVEQGHVVAALEPVPGVDIASQLVGVVEPH